MRYLISYDLRKPGRNYDALWDLLTGIRAHRVLQSQFVVRRYNTDSKSLVTSIRSVMDHNDGLLVCELDGHGWYGWNMKNKISEI